MRSPVAVLPLLTLLVVAYLVLIVGAPRPIESLRLFGGPTDGLALFTGVIEADRGGQALALAELDVVGKSTAGRSATAHVRLDAAGRSELALDFGAEPPGAFALTVRHEGREIARGEVKLARERWLAKAPRRGGFFGTGGRGELRMSIAAGRGVFAVPFPGPLLVRVEREGKAVSGAEVEVQSEGARLAPARAVSDVHGLARFELSPREHVVTLLARAREGEHQGELSASVPIAPGAMLATLGERGLRVRSPLPRDVAFVTLLSDSGRLRSVRVPLLPTPEGAESGDVALPSLPQQAVWARVDDEITPSGAAVVGWPLFELSDSPAQTFDARDFTLLDSSAAAQSDERARRRRVLGWALVVGLLGALVSILLVLERARQSSRSLEAHLGQELGSEEALRLAPPARTRSLFGMALIALGFLVVAALLAWRLGF